MKVSYKNTVYSVSKYMFLLILFWILVIIIINLFVLNFSKVGYYKQVKDTPKNYVWLVFGAAVIGKYQPSDILKDRLNVAFSAYKQGKVEKIIVSGDNSKWHYNEPLAMQRYLLNLWVDRDDIYLDYAGFDTYDSLYRARDIFWVQQITLFTQDFHLKRALYIAKRLNIQAVWIETNLQQYRQESYNNRREVLARIKAFLEVEILKSEPKYLWDSIEIITDEKIGEAKKELIR